MSVQEAAARLTEKQKRFADFYLELGDGTEAYVRAGYSVKSRDVAKVNASRLLTNANVRAYVDALVASKDEKRIAKQDEVLEFLSAVMRGEVTEKIPLGLGGGLQELVDAPPRVSDRKAAADLLGKRYGSWIDRQQVDANVVVIKGEENLAD